ncbi:hypothetical protein ACFYWN_43645 [Streptomyces sp. NPDC002917]|uniref:hypothetical protein n=1 Tax=Streptomyces sp. NPDC002917 TaxID=3364671 RepID=UPI0036830166
MDDDRAQGIAVWVWVDDSGDEAAGFERPASAQAVEVWTPLPDDVGRSIAVSEVITMALRTAYHPRQRPRPYCVDVWLSVKDGCTAVSFDPVYGVPAHSVPLPGEPRLLHELRAVFLACVARRLDRMPLKERRNYGLPENSSSIRAFSGGLPGLGKRR